jgi:hypothetical protein
MDLHVLPNLEIVTIVFASFDLCMSKTVVNTVVLVINYLDESSTFIHVVMKLFEVHDIVNNTMILQFQTFRKQFESIHHLITIVKDDNSNVQFMVTTL